ncbi:hypothetical protein LSH36_154g03000 [Paralvinella palmiformis]|uniref:Uncharacterized protein n=1 Tax=Paralvinella palmiformis TaxID=53620 RepID=A0AAD9JTY9_9ANNE|nr:hypothetical protein LSH36_154g03000 [Paralvinella palmiformis]
MASVTLKISSKCEEVNQFKETVGDESSDVNLSKLLTAVKKVQQESNVVLTEMVNEEKAKNGIAQRPESEESVDNDSEIEGFETNACSRCLAQSRCSDCLILSWVAQFCKDSYSSIRGYVSEKLCEGSTGTTSTFRHGIMLLDDDDDNDDTNEPPGKKSKS